MARTAKAVALIEESLFGTRDQQQIVIKRAQHSSGDIREDAVPKIGGSQLLKDLKLNPKLYGKAEDEKILGGGGENELTRTQGDSQMKYVWLTCSRMYMTAVKLR